MYDKSPYSIVNRRQIMGVTRDVNYSYSFCNMMLIEVHYFGFEDRQSSFLASTVNHKYTVIRQYTFLFINMTYVYSQ